MSQGIETLQLPSHLTASLPTRIVSSRIFLIAALITVVAGVVIMALAAHPEIATHAGPKTLLGSGGAVLGTGLVAALISYVLNKIVANRSTIMPYTRVNINRVLEEGVLDPQAMDFLTPLAKAGLRDFQEKADAFASATDFDPERLLRAVPVAYLEDFIRLHAKCPKELKPIDSEGNTLLHIAYAYNRMDIVNYLVGEGVDENAINKAGKTPKEEAGEGIKKLVQEKLQEQFTGLRNDLDALDSN